MLKNLHWGTTIRIVLPQLDVRNSKGFRGYCGKAKNKIEGPSGEAVAIIGGVRQGFGNCFNQAHVSKIGNNFIHIISRSVPRHMLPFQILTL